MTRPSLLLVILTVLGFGLIAGCAGETNPSNKAATEFFEDFRNKKLSELVVKPSRVGIEDLLKAAPEGLRITSLADDDKPDYTGVAPDFNVRGDFEITARYEFIQVEPPKPGPNVKFEIYLKTKSASTDAMAFYRLFRFEKPGEFLFARMRTNEQGKRQGLSGQTLGDITASGKSGQLRITRKGSDAVLSAAEPAGADFRELYRVPLGTEDIIRVRVAVNPGGAVDFVDPRLVDLRVRGTLISKGPNAVGTKEITPHPRGLWLWLVAVLFALTLICGGLWAWLAKRRGNLNENKVEEIKEEE